ncbi:MAG: prolyl oligopeptidase family serine peptidase [Roseivirga sp.]|nr:prolyl oligopeptidase family serine peptidase [Roseivirga sp.]
MKFCCLLFVCGLLFNTQLQAQADLGENKVLQSQNLNYRVALPDKYSKEGKGAPLILFLHGGDGSNTKHHPKKYAEQAGIDFPFMVVAPHCNLGCSWSTVDYDALLSEVLRGYNVDKNRIYVTGYSMGGYGTWSAISKFPDLFAAAAPIAGGGNTKTICNAKEVAIRAYHGNKDSITPYSGSQKLISKLEGCGAKAELLTIQNGDHWIWPDLFKDKTFYDWLLAQSR